MYFYLYKLNSVSQIFKILFQIGGINVFVFRDVLSFSDEKTTAVNSENLVEKLSKINMAKYQRKIPSMAEVGALQNCSSCKTTLLTLIGMCL